MISIFHISDFHFRADHPSIERLGSLVSDIEKNRPNNDAYLVFSGDLGFSGVREQYESLLEHFFVPLESFFKKIYLVPGNHDISRKDADEDQVKSLFEDKSLSYLYNGGAKIKLENPFKGTNPLEEYQNLEALLSSSQSSNYFYWNDLNEDFDVVGFTFLLDQLDDLFVFLGVFL